MSLLVTYYLVFYTVDILDRKQIQMVFLFKFKMGLMQWRPTHNMDKALELLTKLHSVVG